MKIDEMNIGMRVGKEKPTNPNAPSYTPSYTGGPPERLYHSFWNICIEKSR